MCIRNIVPVFALSALALLTSCNETKKKDTFQNENRIAENIVKPEEVIEDKLSTIADFVIRDKGFSTLTSAIKAAEFIEVLDHENENSYTIFAPANIAFNKLPKGTIERLLKLENKKELESILKCHVISGIVNEEDITTAIHKGNGSTTLKTIGGELLTASIKDKRVFLIDKRGNGGTLITTDVKASNGVIHTIDAVMMPEK